LVLAGVKVLAPAVAMVIASTVPERVVTAVTVVAIVACAVDPVSGTLSADIRVLGALVIAPATVELVRLGTGFRKPAVRASVCARVVPCLGEVGQSKSCNGEGEERVLEAVHCLLSSVLAKAPAFARAVRLGRRC